MAGKVTEWPSNRGPISKIWPSDGCGRKALLMAGGWRYHFYEFRCHLGNVGLYPSALCGLTVL